MRFPYLLYKSIILQATLIGMIPVFTIFSILVLTGLIFPGFHQIPILVTISTVLGFAIEFGVIFSGYHWTKRMKRVITSLIEKIKNYLNKKEK